MRSSQSGAYLLCLVCSLFQLSTCDQNKVSSNLLLIKPAISPPTKDTIYPEQRLAVDLLAGYQAWARPCKDCSKPIQVSIEFSLMQINALDEKTQVLTTTGWLTVRWMDEKLKWDPEEYGNLTTIEIPANLVWVPIFGLDNHARSLYDPAFRSEFYIRVDHRGYVHWDVGNQFISSCGLSLFYYPWDIQACVLSFQSYSHTADKMILYAAKPFINLEDFTTNGEWGIRNTTACQILSLYNVSLPDGFWSVHFEIQLDRKPKFYITHMITPCVVLAILVLVVFWLPPEAGEKVSLAMTILLSFSVFLLMIAENMPKTSESVPLVAIYLASFMAASAISIVLSVWVLRCFYHDLNCKSRRTSRLCRKFIRNFAYLVDVDDETVEHVLTANRGHRRHFDMNRIFNLTEVKGSMDNIENEGSPFLQMDHFDKSPNIGFSMQRRRYIRQIAHDVNRVAKAAQAIHRHYEEKHAKEIYDDSCINEWRR